MAGLGAESRRVLLGLASASLRRLEEGFEASDPRRAGIVTHAHFRGVLESEGFNNPEVSDEIASAYALDNQQGSIWWAALLREIKVLRDPKAAHAQSRAALGGVDSPTRGSATNASSSYEDDPEDPIAPRDARGKKVSDETARLIQELAKFFKFIFENKPNTSRRHRAKYNHQEQANFGKGLEAIFPMLAIKDTSAQAQGLT